MRTSRTGHEAAALGMGAEDPQQLSKSQMKRRQSKAGQASTTAAPPGPAFIAAKKTKCQSPRV